MRRFCTLLVSVAVMFLGLSVNAGAAGDKNTFTAIGEASFHANHIIQLTFHWDPEHTDISRGSRITARDDVEPADLFGGGHTFTIVKASDVPTDIKGAIGETCFPDPSSPNQGCAAAGAHFATDPPTPVVNVGMPGIDQPGDSMLVPPGGEVSAMVTAPRGTTLHFICTFHPWMQGEFTVR
jgi:hypothetical protein